MDSHVGFPCSPSGKNNLPTKAGDIRDLGSIPGLGRYHGGGNGNQLQCSCLENPRDQGAWWAAIYGVAQSQTRLSNLAAGSAEYIMRNTELDEAQGRIKIAGRNINNLRYAHDTILMAESEEELKSVLTKQREE